MVSRFSRHVLTSVARALYHDPVPVGGIAVALMLGTSALLQVSVSLPLLIVGGCGTALVYGVDRVVTPSPEDAINRPDRHRWVEAHRGWLRLEMGILLVVSCATIPLLQENTLWAVVPLVVVVALHLVPGEDWGRPLQRVALVKPLAVAGAWAVGGALLPMLERGALIGGAAVCLVGYRMLFILPNVLLADWGDREGDAVAGLASWTPSGSLHTLRLISSLLLGVGILGAGVAVSNFGAPGLLLVDAVGLVLMLAATWTVHPGHSAGHAFLLDLIVAWPLVPWVVHHFGLL